MAIDRTTNLTIERIRGGGNELILFLLPGHLNSSTEKTLPSISVPSRPTIRSQALAEPIFLAEAAGGGLLDISSYVRDSFLLDYPSLPPSVIPPSILARHPPIEFLFSTRNKENLFIGRAWLLLVPSADSSRSENGIKSRDSVKLAFPKPCNQSASREYPTYIISGKRSGFGSVNASHPWRKMGLFNSGKELEAPDQSFQLASKRRIWWNRA